MIYYLNELSIKTPCVETIILAQELMKDFVRVCNEAKKLGYTQLRFSISLKGICLSENYFVATWLKDEEVDIDEKRRFRNINNKSPYFEGDDTLILKQQDTSIYSYKNEIALGLGFAHLKETLAVSFSTDAQWNSTEIELEQLFEATKKVVKVERHAAHPSHIKIMKRVFEFNPKHGRCGKGAHSGQSIMYCCHESEAELLLNTALLHPKKDKWFCNYDTANKRFIVFLPHEVNKGKYHGFHYENTLNDDPDRDLNNSQNGIPKQMQLKLKDRMIDL